MKKGIPIILIILLTLAVTAGCADGLLIRELPDKITVNPGEKAEFGFVLDNTGNDDLTDISLMLEEILNDQGSDEILGSLTFVTYDGIAVEEETDFYCPEVLGAGTSVKITAAYQLPAATEEDISLRVTVYDEDFNGIASAKTRCIIPETAENGDLAVGGIPVRTVILILALLNIAVWSVIILRSLVKKKHASRDERR